MGRAPAPKKRPPKCRRKPGFAAVARTAKKSGPAPLGSTVAPPKAQASTSTAKATPKARTLSKVRLSPQGTLPRGLQIDNLPKPSAEETDKLPADVIAWVGCLLPANRRNHTRAIALAHHIALIPHLGLDPDLSIAICFLRGYMTEAELRRTDFWKSRRETHWVPLRVTLPLCRGEIYHAVKLYIDDICVSRSKAMGSPTHKISFDTSKIMPVSRTAAFLGVASSYRGKKAAGHTRLHDSPHRQLPWPDRPSCLMTMASLKAK